MFDDTKHILKKIIVHNGRKIIDDKQKIKAMLTDLSPNTILERNLLINALELKIPSKIIATTNVPQTIFFSQLATQLEKNFGIEITKAEWAVKTWAFALNIDVKTNVQAKMMTPEIVMKCYNKPLCYEHSWPVKKGEKTK